MQQRSHSSLASSLFFGGLTKIQPLAWIKQINPSMAKYSTMASQKIPKDTKLIKTQFTWPKGYTKEDGWK